MALAFFWLKIAFRRIIAFIKLSPVIIVGASIFIAALVITRQDVNIPLDNSRFAVVTGVLFGASLLASAKKHDISSVLTLYAKSNDSNPAILKKYFLLYAVLNTIPLLLFAFLVWYGTFKVELSAYLPVITILSILCSFFLMRLQYTYNRKSVKPKKIFYIYPCIKSAVYDYCTAGFLLGAIISIAFFMILIAELIKNNNLLYEMQYPDFFFIYALIPAAFGIINVIDSIPHSNWKFFAVVYPKPFAYHFKRIFFFLTAFFGLFILLFFGIVASFDIRLLPKYLFSFILILLFTINTAYSTGNMLMKACGCIGFIAAVLWIGSFNPYLLLVLLLPLGYTLWKAVNDYKDWYIP